MTKRAGLSKERLEEIRCWQTSQRRFADAAVTLAVNELMGHIAALEAELKDARAGLEKSVTLQSHYAVLLNQYDGGKRLIFATAQQWLDRLAAITKEHQDADSD